MSQTVSVQKENSASTFVPPKTSLAPQRSPQADSTQTFVPRDTGLQMSTDWSVQASPEQGLTMEDIDKQLASPSSGFMDQLVSGAEEPPNTESVGVQPKLAIGQVGDPYEVEADQVADRVMKMPEPVEEQFSKNQGEVVQRQPVALSISRLVQRQQIQAQAAEQKWAEADGMGQEQINLAVQRKCSKCQEEEEQEKGIQRKEITPESGMLQAKANSSLESRLAANAGGGSALPDDVRSFMEPRFGADFNSVRVHTDSQAVQMSQELGAQAFTYGNDIYYGQGKSPGNNDLTAHELTHTIQQMGAVQAKPTVNQLGKQKAQETESMASEVGSQMNVPQSQSVQNVVMLRLLEPDPKNRVGWDSGLNTPLAVGKLDSPLFVPEGEKGFYSIAQSGSGFAQFNWARSTPEESSLVAEMHINSIGKPDNNYLGLQQNIQTAPPNQSASSQEPTLPGGINFNDPVHSPFIVDIEKIKFRIRATLSPGNSLRAARATYYFNFCNPNIKDESIPTDCKGNEIAFDILQYVNQGSRDKLPIARGGIKNQYNDLEEDRPGKPRDPKRKDTWQIPPDYWSGNPKLDFSAKKTQGTSSQGKSVFDFSLFANINQEDWLDVEIPVANIIEEMINGGQLKREIVEGAKYTGGTIGGLEIFGEAEAKLQVKDHTMIIKKKFRPEVFNWQEYLALNPDLGTPTPFNPNPINTESEAHAHWDRFGSVEGRPSSTRFGVKDYLKRYPFLDSFFSMKQQNEKYPAAIEHYIDFGLDSNFSGQP